MPGRLRHAVWNPFETDRGAANHHILKSIPADAGPRVHARCGSAVYSVRQPGSQTFRSEAPYVAVTLAPSPRMKAAFDGEKLKTFDAVTGAIAVCPANVGSRLHWTHRRENVVVAIEPETLEELAASEFDIGGADLVPTRGVVDPQALLLAQQLKAELIRNERSNELYVDSLITLFGLHVLRRYSSGNGMPMRAGGGLSGGAAKRVTEYLEEHLTHKVSVAELAAICGLSPGYFIHSFTKTFKMPPHRYLTERRLDFAEKLLLETDLKIAEVAFTSGFSSQSHLTTTMRKYRRTTPGQVRAQR